MGETVDVDDILAGPWKRELEGQTRVATYIGILLSDQIRHIIEKHKDEFKLCDVSGMITAFYFVNLLVGTKGEQTELKRLAQTLLGFDRIRSIELAYELLRKGKS